MKTYILDRRTMLHAKSYNGRNVIDSIKETNKIFTWRKTSKGDFEVVCDNKPIDKLESGIKWIEVVCDNKQIDKLELGIKWIEGKEL